MNAIKLAFASTILASAHAYPAAFPNIPFNHQDWELVCDNTRTCRAAGYQPEQAERNASILLTRRAGPAAPVQAELQLEATDESIPKRLRMRINGHDFGDVAITGGKAGLSPSQTVALLNALPKASQLAWTANGKSWAISLKGANAVLLKMDEFQGRLDTPGAIIRKGQRPESAVLPSLPVPEITAAPFDSDKAQPDLIPPKQRAALFAEIRKATPKDEMNLDSCEDFDKSTADPEKWSVYRLSAKQHLVSVECWSAAYNSGAGYWVVNAQSPYAPVYVTNLGTGYVQGEISSSQRGRGIGDCMSSDTWTWDGRAFVHTESLTTGMCRHIAPGGAWELPTLIVKVKEPK
jgi:hypothetical protein